MRQRELILHHLKLFGSITPGEALNQYGIMRLGARIWELKNEDGYNISMTLKKGTNRLGYPCHFAEYKLVS